MPGCVLHVRGGALTCPPELKPIRESAEGFVVLVSDADGASFARQVEEATVFLDQHAEALAALAADDGFEAAELDFGVWSQAPMQSHRFPARLITLAAQCAVGLRLSVYLADDA